MLNPPGVSVMANEIQNPPYEERAVAPKVLPTAISLTQSREPFLKGISREKPLCKSTYHMPASN